MSSIVVKYQIVKLEENKQDCNLDYYIDQYISAKQLDGLSKKTLKGYRLELNILSKVIHKNVEAITTAHIRNYLSNYEHLKTSSLATKISTIKSFFVWLVQEEIFLRGLVIW